MMISPGSELTSPTFDQRKKSGTRSSCTGKENRTGFECGHESPSSTLRRMMEKIRNAPPSTDMAIAMKAA